MIPLFEQLEDLQNSVDVLEEMIKIPEVQARLKATGGKMEVMLGYSDSSKDAGPTSATPALHSAQERIAKWAESHDIDLTLFHGRGGAVGRGGPANRAVLAQPVGSVKCRFKLTEQGEVIFARYGNPVLAIRHVESVAAATLLQSAPSVEKRNTDMTKKYADMASKLDEAAHNRFLDLLNTDGFAPWFSTVTPLTEIGLLPIGSPSGEAWSGRQVPRRSAHHSVDLLLGPGPHQPGRMVRPRHRVRAVRRPEHLASGVRGGRCSPRSSTTSKCRWPRPTSASPRCTSPSATVRTSTRRSSTRWSSPAKWVLKIVGDEWPLQHRHVLGQAIRIRSPYVDALSVTQVLALGSLRKRVDKEELTHGQKENYTYLILCTVSGVAAGLQNTG